MTRVTRRAALAFAIAFALFTVLPVSAASGPVPGGSHETSPEARTQPDAVTWKVDDAAKTITATVRLQLGSTCTRAAMVRAVQQGPAAAARCKVGPEVVKAIKDSVDAVWNSGHTFLCYKLVVVMDITVADPLAGAAAGSAAAPPDREFVAIDQTTAAFRSYVSADTPAGSAWALNGPENRLVPTNDPAETSTWAYPPSWDVSVYAHEVAHVLGLSDQYEDFVDARDGKTYSQPKQGAPDDVMSNVTKTNVDQSTVDRLVQRAGVDWTKLKCDYTVDRTVPGGKITGTKCSGIDGDWVINADVKSGPATVHQKWTVTIDGATQVGTFVYEDTTHTEVRGTTADSVGVSSGRSKVVMPGGGPVFMDLWETHHTASGTATAAGRTIKVPPADEPLVVKELEWRPTVCP